MKEDDPPPDALNNAADALSIDFERVRIIDGDTDKVKSGFGSHGSRSMRIGGGALVHGTRKMIERGRELAADELEATVADLEDRDGKFVIAGTDRGIDLFDLAKARAPHGESVAGEAVFDTHNHAFANGCHVCELEVDPQTGQVKVLNYVLVTDVGRVINPLITEGQLHGGIVQGIGQALFEHVQYEPGSGQVFSSHTWQPLAKA